MSSQSKIILNANQLQLTIHRLSCEIVENLNKKKHTVILGMQPRGVLLAEEIHSLVNNQVEQKIYFGSLDTTFFRDDFRRRKDVLLPHNTSIDFSLEAANVILIDDVLFTGRSIRAGLDALVSFGRPDSVELLVLIDRRFSRELPIQPKYVGKSIDVIDNEHVVVNLTKHNSNVVLSNKEV